MKKFLKFLLVLFIWTLIAGASIGGALLAGSPVQTGLWIFGGLFAAWLLFLVARKALIYYSAKKKVESLVNVEQGEKRSWSFSFNMQPSGLEKNFKSVVALLKKSYLKVHGDPLYVLPWYLVVGHSGNGKTYMMENANLLSPTIEDEGLLKSDEDINWCLYNQAIVIDTPGSYLSSEEGNRNNKWLQLLDLLKKYRHKEPLNGVIVTLSMDDLLEGNSQKLMEMGLQARKNVEQLMQSLHLQVPVYLVVTKLDKLQGIEQWIGSLDHESLKDPMGQVNDQDDEAATFVKKAVVSIAERLKQLMLSTLKDGNVSSQLLRLPTQFESLERHLNTYAQSLFQVNPYQKTPFFRGLYFVGEAKGIHLQTATEGRGIFAHRLLTQIMPAERRMVTSLARSERVERNRRFGKVAFWNAGIAALILVLFVSYRSSMGALDEIVQLNAGNFEESIELESNITTLYEYRDMVNQLDSRSWAPWFGMGGAPEFVEKLDGIFAERVQTRLVETTDQVFVKELANVFNREGDISEEKIVAFISTLVRRINILDAYLEGASDSSLSDMAMPYSLSDADFFGIDDDATIDKLNTLYLQSLIWTADKSLLHQELELMHHQLNGILVKSKDLANWLIPWANKVAKSEERRVSDFWLVGSGKMQQDTIVLGAFSLTGKQLIDDFIEQIKATKRYDEILQKILPGFQADYKKQYLASWESFARNFSNGTQKLRSRTEWLSVINNLSTGRNLYFNAFNLIDEQISVYKDSGENPDWAQMMGYYQEMRAFAPDEKTDNGKSNKMFAKMALKVVGKAGPLGKALAKSGKSGMKTQKKMAKASGGSGPSADERAMQVEAAGKLLGEYRQALSDFVYSAEVRSVSHAVTGNLYTNPDNPAMGEGSLAAGYTALKKLQAIVGKESESNKAFWEIYRGPLELMQSYMLSESSCSLQDTWSNEFLINLEGVPQYKISNLVFGPEGALWGFLDGQAGPFINERFGAGYVAAKALNTVYPLSPNFLEFAARAKDGKQAAQDVYPVQMQGLPTSTNLDAKFHVTKTSLRMQCAAGESTLVNLNFPSNSQFKWSETCSDVSLSIEIGRFNLEKRYDGQLAFPNFLRDFKTGQKRFSAEDFPEFTEKLRQSGISFIDVKYRITGQSELLSALDSKQLSIPRNISACWPTAQQKVAATE